MEKLIKSIENKEFPIVWPGHWISNQWQIFAEQAKSKTSFNPSRDQPLLVFKEHKNAVMAAIDSSEKYRETISQISYSDRIKMIQTLATALADWQTTIQYAMQLESGKPAWEAKADVEAALSHLDQLLKDGEKIYDKLLAPAQIGHLKGKFLTKPIGITAAYLPFTTPITSFVFYFTASILSACPLVLFSSTNGAISSLLYARICEKIGFPLGLINIVFASFDVFKIASKDKRVAAIVYTGSREHCDEIRKDSMEMKGRQLILQSGGKNSVIVDPTANLDLAVKNTIYGIIKSSGQLCTSTSRVFVQSSIFNEFKKKLVEAVDKLEVGPTDRLQDTKGPMMGPLYAKKAIERFLRYQTMGHREAKETLLWGKTKRVEGATEGYFVTPGIHHIKTFDPTNAYQGNILFAPDIALYEYQNLSEAIEKINNTDAAFSVSFMGDFSKLEPHLASFNALNIHINLPTVELEAALPLPGRFSTGLNRFHGPALALYLIVPQVVQTEIDFEDLTSKWPLA